MILHNLIKSYKKEIIYNYLDKLLYLLIIDIMALLQTELNQGKQYLRTRRNLEKKLIEPFQTYSDPELEALNNKFTSTLSEYGRVKKNYMDNINQYISYQNNKYAGKIIKTKDSSALYYVTKQGKYRYFPSAAWGPNSAAAASGCGGPITTVDSLNNLNLSPGPPMRVNEPCGIENKNVLVQKQIGASPNPKYCTKWVPTSPDFTKCGCDWTRNAGSDAASYFDSGFDWGNSYRWCASAGANNYGENCTEGENSGCRLNSKGHCVTKEPYPPPITSRECDETIPSDETGYCVCMDGSKKAIVDTGHLPFTCTEACTPEAPSFNWKDIANCQTQRESGVCQVCKKGFTLMNNACAITPIANCTDQQGTVCNACRQYWNLENNKCVQPPVPFFIGSNYPYHSENEARDACINAGFDRLCNKPEMPAKCACGWYMDNNIGYPGYKMDEDAAGWGLTGCGGTNTWNNCEWTDARGGAYCCNGPPPPPPPPPPGPPPNATSCGGDACNYENQFCPPSVDGGNRSPGGMLCVRGRWTAAPYTTCRDANPGYQLVQNVATKCRAGGCNAALGQHDWLDMCNAPQGNEHTCCATNANIFDRLAIRPAAPSCFHPETLVTMQDGSKKPMKDIEFDDILEGNRTVTATLKIKGGEIYYKIYSEQLKDFIFVTGFHLIQEPCTNNFIPVSEYSGSIKTDSATAAMSCLVTSDNCIPVGEYLFWDWED